MNREPTKKRLPRSKPLKSGDKVGGAGLNHETVAPSTLHSSAEKNSALPSTRDNERETTRVFAELAGAPTSGPEFERQVARAKNSDAEDRAKMDRLLELKQEHRNQSEQARTKATQRSRKKKQARLRENAMEQKDIQGQLFFSGAAIDDYRIAKHYHYDLAAELSGMKPLLLAAWKQRKKLILDERKKTKALQETMKLEHKELDKILGEMEPMVPLYECLKRLGEQVEQIENENWKAALIRLRDLSKKNERETFDLILRQMLQGMNDGDEIILYEPEWQATVNEFFWRISDPKKRERIKQKIKEVRAWERGREKAKRLGIEPEPSFLVLEWLEDKKIEVVLDLLQRGKKWEEIEDELVRLKLDNRHGSNALTVWFRDKIEPRMAVCRCV